MLKHLKARKDWEGKSLTAKGFTLIELLVVIVILGILAGVVIFAIGAIQDRAQKNTCQTDYNTLKTAIAAWTAAYEADQGEVGTVFDTKYPTSETDLVSAGEEILEAPSDLWNFTSSGATYPTITAQPGTPTKCDIADVT